MVDANLLLDLVTVAGRPVSLRACASALDASENDVIDTASDLVAQGRLVESADGYAAPDDTPDVSPVRSARAPRVLAKGLIATESDPAWIGSVLARSDTPGEAIPYLVRAADALAAEGDVIEAMVPAGQVLDSGDDIDRATEGRMHLIRGQGRQFSGDSEGASEDFEDAAARLEGESRIDALGYASTGASNLQQPQRAERLLATAAAESIPDFPAKLGSLSALWAREVSRLGFPDEAEALLDKSDALLDEHGSSFQRYLAKWNRAWIYVDRGDYRRAEADLDALVHTAEDNDHASADVAEKKAYHGRALFGVGRPKAAMERLAEASVDATPSIRYLVALADSEGYPRYGAWAQAMEATDRLRESVEELVPAWRNVGLFLRAKALAGSGDLDEARRTVAEAILACPPGVNGWRWRQRCRALQMDLAARAGEPFPEEEAEGLAEEMLRAQWLGPAAELLVSMARHTNTPERARQAMALAWKGGDAMLAAEAADVAGAWDSELASPIIDRIRRIAGELPEDMETSLRALPHAAAALTVEREVSEDESALRAEYEEALTAVLGDDPTLTPAQRRRAKTLAARRRRAGLVRGFGGVAIVAVAVLAWIGLNDPPVATTTTISTTTTSTTTVPRYLPPPDPPLAGTSTAHGGSARTGVFLEQPPSNIDRPYWEYQAGDSVRTAPVVFGTTVYVGSDDRSLHAIDLEKGTSRLYDAGAPIASTPAIGSAEIGEGTSSNVLFFGDDDGFVHAVNVNLSRVWRFRTGGRVTGSPVLTDEGSLVVPSQDGFLYGLNPTVEEELWRYPTEEMGPVAPFSSDIAYHDGIVYAIDDDGVLHIVDVAEDGAGVCAEPVRGGGAAVPVVTAEAVFVAKPGAIDVFPAGACAGVPEGLLEAYFTQSTTAITPAVGDDEIIFPVSQTLVTAELGDGSDRWVDPAILGSTILAPAVIAGDLVIVGDSAGTLYARDLATGAAVWSWPVGAPILREVAVIDRAIIVVTNTGQVIALGMSG